jgi:hypothetical protein
LCTGHTGTSATDEAAGAIFVAFAFHTGVTGHIAFFAGATICIFATTTPTTFGVFVTEKSIAAAIFVNATILTGVVEADLTAKTVFVGATSLTGVGLEVTDSFT